MRGSDFNIDDSDDSDVSPRPTKRAMDMTYGELQKECKRLKIKATGGTSALQQRIIAKRKASAGAADTQSSVPAPVEPVQPAAAAAAAAAVVADDSGGNDSNVATAAAAVGPFGQLTDVSAAVARAGGFGDGANDGSGFALPGDSAGDAASTAAAGPLPPPPPAPLADNSAAAAPTKEKPAERFVDHELARIVEVIADPVTQSAVAQLNTKKNRAVIDEKIDLWVSDIAPRFNSDKEYTHVEWDDTKSAICSSPRNDTSRLNPNQKNCKNELRTGAQLKKQWAGMKGHVGSIFKNWEESGQGLKGADQGQSAMDEPISNYIHGKSTSAARVIKYMFLRFKDNPDLMSFAVKTASSGTETQTKKQMQAANAGSGKEKPKLRGGTSPRADAIAQAMNGITTAIQSLVPDQDVAKTQAAAHHLEATAAATTATAAKSAAAAQHLQELRETAKFMKEIGDTDGFDNAVAAIRTHMSQQQ
jgi:hypothetical protein